MPSLAHQVLVNGCSSKILSKIEEAGWKHEEQPMETCNTYCGTCRLIFGRKGSKPRRDLDPDASLRCIKSTFPFLVMLATVSRKWRSLRKTVHCWVEGSRQHLKILCLLHIEKDSAGGYRALASIIRPRRIPCPTNEMPDRFRVQSDYIIEREQVYPAESPASFEIAMKGLLPRGTELD